MNQTLDSVRRLAISRPGPGMGGVGSPGGLLDFANSSDYMIGSTTGIVPGFAGGTNPTLSQGQVNPIGISADDTGKANVSPDTGTTLTVYNLSPIPIASGVTILSKKIWGLWVPVPFTTEIFQALVPGTGSYAASGGFPARPGSFTADVYTLDKSPTKVNVGATIYIHATGGVAGGKVVFIKVNADGSYSVINQIC